jgi:hypothetical protein
MVVGSVRTVSTLVITAMLVGACASTPADAPLPSAPEFAAWEPSTADRDSLNRAEEILIARCMSAEGFRYALVVPSIARVGSRPVGIVLDDAAWAAVHGYGSADADRVDAIVAANPNPTYALSLPPGRRRAYQVALVGIRARDLQARLPDGRVIDGSGDGCIATARRQLYGDLPGWFRADAVLSALEPSVEQRVRRDPAFAAGVAAWAACIHRAGYQADTPDELRAGLRAGGPRSAEITLAVAEARCGASSGLGDLVRALSLRHRAAVRRPYMDLVDTDRRLVTAAVIRARDIVRAS